MIFIKFKTAGIISSVNLSLYTKSLFFRDFIKVVAW